MRRRITRSLAVTAVTMLALCAPFLSGTDAQSTVIPTRTELQSSANPSPAAQALTLTARVYPLTSSSSVPTGAVHFFAGNSLLGTATLVEVDGVAAASLAVANLRPGPHLLIARFPGDGSFGRSDSVPPLPQIVTGQ